SPSLGTVAGQSPRFGVAPVRADMGEGPGIPRFCQQVGAELLAVELGLGQAVSQNSCLAFFEARGQAAALSTKFCQQAYAATDGLAGSVVANLGGPFATMGQCLSAVTALGNFR